MTASLRPLRIVCVTKSTGGLAQYNRVLCQGLAARGHEVSSICLSDGGAAYAEALRAGGIAAQAWPMARYRVSPRSDLRLACRLRRHLLEHPSDVVLGHGAKAGFLVRAAGRLTRTPAVYAMHSLPFLSHVQGGKARVYGYLERLASSGLGGHIVVLTRSMQRIVEDNRVARRGTVTVIYTGIDTTSFSTPRDKAGARAALGLDPELATVGWCGRLTRQKAPERFVGIATALGRTHPQTQFIMAGDGEMGATLRQQSEDAKLGARLQMTPWLDDVAGLYAACDVFVLTSRWEGLPLSLLEAMASGCAVVATAVDGIGEAVRDGVDGLLCADGDNAALARSVAQLLDDPTRRAELAHSARDRVRTLYDRQRMISEWEILLRRQSRNGNSDQPEACEQGS